MKICVVGDTHLGFGRGSELENDCFEVLEEIFKELENYDLVLMLGDIFHTKDPKLNVLSKSVSILSESLKFRPGTKLLGSDKRLSVSIKERIENSLPIVAIAGNHERRARGEVNVLNFLENVGLILYLDRNWVRFEKNGVRVSIFGMSNVPERLAKDILYAWNPRPFPDSFNLLLLHQDIYPYIYSTIDEWTLKASMLPKGFDVILNGHIHLKKEASLNGSLLLMPGSTIPIQFNKKEAEVKKGWLSIELKEKVKYEWVELKRSRKFFYEEMEVEDISEIEERIKSILKANFLKKPILKFRLKIPEFKLGELKKLEEAYREKAILKFGKEVLESEVKRSIESMKDLLEGSLSLEEFVLASLGKKLEELKFSKSFDFEQLFKILADDKTEDALKILVGGQKTLTCIGGKSPSER